MKALTICEPYATMIAVGQKRVENRNWATSYRGPLAIHAGKSRSWLPREEVPRLTEALGRPLTFGAIIAIATVAECLHVNRIANGAGADRFPWLLDHDHTLGPWCWVLTDVVAIQPVTVNGAQGLWSLPAEVLSALMDAVRAVDHTWPAT